MSAGKGNIQVVSVYFLPCFRSPGVRAAATRAVLILQLDLEGVFSRKEISLSTKLRGGKGVGSKTVTAYETFQSYIPVTHKFFGGGFPAAEVERGVATALKS